MKPGHADALSLLTIVDARTDRFDGAHDLMPRDNRRANHLEIALDDMQIGPAHPTGTHSDQNFVRRRLGNGYIREPQRMRLDRSGGVENHGSHEEATLAPPTPPPTPRMP